jgi:hypothetical protein
LNSTNEKKETEQDDDTPSYLLGDSKAGKTFGETYKLDKDVSFLDPIYFDKACFFRLTII